MRVNPTIAPPPEIAPFPEPSVAGMGGAKRWLMYQADFPAPVVSRGGTVHCKVCRLLCGVDFSDNKVNKGYVAGTPPSQLMLCKRHYAVINKLVEQDVQLDSWPSQLVRGMVNHYAEVVWAMNVAIPFMQNSIEDGQQTIASTPTMRTMPFLMPITGFSFNPSISGSFTDYDFFFPSMINVPNKKGISDIESITYAQNSLRASINEAQGISQRCMEEQQKFQGILGHLLKENEPKFLSCLNCGQSEIPLESKFCPWCGQSRVTFRDEALPRKALVQEVDPKYLLPEYDDLVSPSMEALVTGSGNKNAATSVGNSTPPKARREESVLYCQQCGAKQDNLNAKFCFSCGSKIGR